MERNLNHGEATVRGLLGVLSTIVGWNVLLWMDDATGLLLAATIWTVGIGLMLSATTGICPLYHQLGWSTRHPPQGGLDP